MVNYPNYRRQLHLLWGGDVAVINDLLEGIFYKSRDRRNSPLLTKIPTDVLILQKRYEYLSENKSPSTKIKKERDRNLTPVH